MYGHAQRYCYWEDQPVLIGWCLTQWIHNFMVFDLVVFDLVAWVGTATTLFSEYVLHFGTLCLHKVVIGNCNCSQARCMWHSFYNLTISPIPVLSNKHGHLFMTSLIPRLPWNANMYHGESLVSLLCKHDVIEIGLKQKGNVLYIVQPTNYAFNTETTQYIQILK